MKAVVVEAPGERDVLSVQKVAMPSVSSGQVLIKVHYAACNWGDVQKRQGIYPDPVDYPCILGAEGVGEVVQCGPNTTRVQEGQFAMFIAGLHMFGAFAEYVSVPEALVIPLASGTWAPEHAAYPVAALTAYHLVHTAFPLQRSHKLLVHSVSGGVGLMVAQWAARIGAHVYGTVGTPDKIEQAMSLGADRVIARAEEDFVEVITQETQGAGVDLVIDSLGSDILKKSFDVLTYFGHLINIGEAAGDPDFPIRAKLYERSTSMAGFEVRHAFHLPERWQAGIQAMQEAMEDGTLHMPIDSTFDLDDIAAAQARMESRQTVGKVLIKVIS